MPDMEESRLGRLMDERRLDLGLDWQDVASRAGVSSKTLYNARLPSAPLPAPRTRRKIEDALRWQPGSMERVHGGADPEPAPLSAPAAVPLSGSGTLTVSADDEAVAREAEILFPGDRTKQAIWATREPREVKLEIIALIDRKRGAAPPAKNDESAAG
jgi:hypothetical protein